MAHAETVREIGRSLDDPADLSRVVDDVLALREPTTLLALGEPTGSPCSRCCVTSCAPPGRPRLPVGRVGDRHIFAAVVDDYVAGGPADLDKVSRTIKEKVQRRYLLKE